KCSSTEDVCRSVGGRFLRNRAPAAKADGDPNLRALSRVSPFLCRRFSGRVRFKSICKNYTARGGEMRSINNLLKWMSCLTLFLSGLLVTAQVDQARIVGVVRDPSKATISGATVVVKNERTGEQRTTTTNEQGYYALLALQPSVYSVKVTAAQ